MKTFFRTTILLVAMLLLRQAGHAQDNWPKVIVSADGTQIKIYPFQPESFSGNELKSLAAISVTKPGAHDPVFGSFWLTAKVETDREARSLTISSVKIRALKIPVDTSKADIASLKATLINLLPSAVGAIPLDELLSSLSEESSTNHLSAEINTAVPQFIFTTQPSVLVTIDGTPVIRKNKKWGLNQVINTPFTIVQDKDNQFYLYGGQNWYSASTATGPYVYIHTKLSHRLKKIQRQVSKNESDQPSAQNSLQGAVNSTIPAVIITTVPAELIEIDGQAKYLPIAGTSLLYVGNTPNDLFLDTQKNLYYILISGRWYQSSTLSADGQWTFVASDKLPSDFAKIPEGSPKDNVLSSVAGTKAAKEAVMDAQIPQTAKVDRKSATTKVTYDGEPQFVTIDEASLQYATNTSSTVIFDGHNYFALDNGVWFISQSATGPWAVSTTRPDNLNKIPPSVPVYNAQFVDIYDITPDYIYMGYTPGYLNSYIYGSTLVYGTGFYYRPWMGHFYYPRPWSWGFGMSYSPWFGWGFGLDFGYNWFDYSFTGDWDDWYAGWWGPSCYLPTCWGYSHGYRPNSFYGRNIAFRSDMRVATGSNIYRNRTGVVIRNHGGFAGNIRQNGANALRRENQRSGLFADRQGNIYNQDAHGKWQAADIRNRSNAMPSEDLNHTRQMRETGQARTFNFQRAQSFSRPVGGFHSFGGRGGGFHGGFGGRR